MPAQPTPAAVARYIASLSRFLAGRSAREAADRSVLAGLTATGRVCAALAPGLELEWLGVAGYRLTYAGCTLYVDPYLSRVPLRDVVQRRRPAPDPSLYARLLDPHAGRVVGVLAGHTHFDHAVDIPAIAARYGAPAYGSASLVQLMRIHGQADQATQVEPRRAYELGPFTVRFIPSLHSKLILGFGVPMDGELTCDHLGGLTPSAYRCGEVYGIQIDVAGTTLYHQGSANLIDDEVPRGGVDVFLAGIAGRGFTADYWARILPRLEPCVVVASHFDDFFRSVEDEPGLSLNVHLAAIPDEIGRVSREFEVAALRPFEPVTG